MQLRTYYNRPDVKRRMLEFLGGTRPNEVSSVYIARCCDAANDRFLPEEPAALHYFLENQHDIGRSLWDKKSVILHLDMDYVNYDFPGEAYVYPDRVFDLLEPVSRAVTDLLAEYHITPLHMISGRGHHFIWRVGAASDDAAQLAQLDHTPKEGLLRYAQVRGPKEETLSAHLGSAFHGAGFMMEYLTHRIIEKCRDQCRIPLYAASQLVAPQEHGRELICLDISEYADQLDTRVVRLPFSAYLKPWQNRMLTEDLKSLVPDMVPVPCNRLETKEAVATMRDLAKAADLAGGTHTWIPQQDGTCGKLIDDYQASPLAAFHTWFYSKPPQPPKQWPHTYDKAIDGIPVECVRDILQHPNPRLLEPACMRLVVCGLLGMDWHPSDIAGLMRSRYEKNFGWGRYWYVYEAVSRSEFFVRLFAGLIAAGRDNLADMTCEQSRRMGICSRNGTPPCGLSACRDHALERVCL